MSESISQIRNQLRKEALQRRDDLAEHLRFAFSHLIRAKVFELVDELELKTVHCYLNFRSEVETLSLVRGLQESGVSVISPVIIGEANQQTMRHYPLSEHLVLGAFGVPEPERTQEADLDLIDAVIIPLVAFDGTGTRLGYGKGFYDRFLASLDSSVKRIGLAFSLQECDEIPRLAHDEQLDMIVTENAIVHTERL